MMHAFLKGGKLPTGKPAANGSQKQKDKKQREKPVPWVEKVKSCIPQFSKQKISIWFPRFPCSIVQRKLMTLWSSRKFAQCLESACRAPTCPTCFCTVPLVSLSCILINCILTPAFIGTGKTSTILAAARQLFGEFFKERVLELNASDDRGIAVIRTKVKNFAQLKASATRPDGKPCPPFKIIILDEADAMTHAAQAALRRTMEKETRTTRFCLVCNYVSRIIDPITSRCTKFRFIPIGDEKIIERLKFICEEEKLKIDEDALKSIVDISGGDMRKAITILQSCYRLKSGTDSLLDDGLITLKDILEMSGFIPEHHLTEFIGICKEGNYSKLEKFVREFMYEAYSIAQFFDQLNDIIVADDSITNEEKSSIFDKLGESSFRLLNGGSEYIQLMDFGCATIVAFKSKN